MLIYMYTKYKIINILMNINIAICFYKLLKLNIIIFYFKKQTN